MGNTLGNESLPCCLTHLSRRQLHPRGSSKRSRSRGNQPFPGLLQPENLSREELIDVLRASVVDQKGEGERDSCTETWEGSLPGG